MTDDTLSQLREMGARLRDLRFERDFMDMFPDEREKRKDEYREIVAEISRLHIEFNKIEGERRS